MKTAKEFWFEYNAQCERMNIPTNTFEAMESFANQSKWISVEEKFPETNEDVLVWSDQMKRPIISFYDSPYGWGGKKIFVSHWMPLPKNP